MIDYHLFIVLVVVGTTLLMVGFVRGNTTLSADAKQRFLFLFTFIALTSVFEWAGVAFDGHGDAARVLIPVFKVLEFSLAPTLGVLYAMVLGMEERILKVAYIALAAHALVECVLAPFGVVFFVDAAGVYHHGAAYGLYMAMYFASAVFMLVAVQRFSQVNQLASRYMPWLVLLFVFACIAGQMLSKGVYVIWLACVIGSMMLYIYYISVTQQTDSLTRLLNRRSFDSAIACLGDASTLLLLDADDFKDVNDTFGHAVGDECLRRIGREMHETFGMVGQCYRIGGDEFCVIVTSKADLPKLKEEFARRLEEVRAELPAMPGVSVGEALFDPACDDVASVYNQADELMYGRKRQRKEHEKIEGISTRGIYG